MLLPLAAVAYFYYRWVGDAKEVAYATVRMSAQLLLIGYILLYLFDNDSVYFGLAILLFMIAVSAWIALRNIQRRDFAHYKAIVFAIAFGGTLNLFLVIGMVLAVEPLYTPRYVIPIAGMIYANAMNAVALAAERFENELAEHSFEKARSIAFKASMIPQINAFLAVGLVSLPGMMTGQILSGVDPLIAARYQMVIMAMVLGSSGLSVILYLMFQKKER